MPRFRRYAAADYAPRQRCRHYFIAAMLPIHYATPLRRFSDAGAPLLMLFAVADAAARYDAAMRLRHYAADLLMPLFRRQIIAIIFAMPMMPIRHAAAPLLSLSTFSPFTLSFRHCFITPMPLMLFDAMPLAAP